MEKKEILRMSGKVQKIRFEIESLSQLKEIELELTSSGVQSTKQ